MSNRIFVSSRPDAWNSPRPYSDASLRMAAHGKIMPMQQPSLLVRLFSRV